MKRSALIAAGAAAVALACSDDITPPKPGDVTVTLDSRPSYRLQYEDELNCTVELTATASGTSAARWMDAKFRWYVGASRSAPLDSTSFPADDIRQSWSRDTIVPRETQEATWEINAEVPFEADLEMRYEVTATKKVGLATTHFACGPTPPAVVNPPRFTETSVQSLHSPAQPGDTIAITYHASSEYALISTTVEAVGAFETRQLRYEGLAPDVKRTLLVPVPHSAVLNAPLRVTVTARDAVGYEVSYSIPNDVVFVDQTAPALHGVGLDWPDHVALGQLSVDLPVGETVVVNVHATDNGRLKWLVYEVNDVPAPVRDSLPAPATALDPGDIAWNVPLVIRPEWQGRPTFSFYVRDAAGLTSAKVSSVPDSIRVFPTVPRPIRSGILQFPGYLSLAHWDTKHQAIYFTQPSTQLDVFSLVDMAGGLSVALPDMAQGMDLTPSGDSLVVALPGARTLAVIDLTRLPHPVTTVRLAKLDSLMQASSGLGPVPGTDVPHPRFVSVSAEGRVMVYLDSRVPTGETVIEHNLGTGVGRMRADVKAFVPGTFGPSQPVGASGDRKHLYSFASGCAQRYDGATDAYSACTTVQNPSAPLSASNLTGTHFAWGNVTYDAQFNRLRSYPSGSVAFSPDGSKTYVPYRSGIAVANSSDGVFVEFIRLPSGVTQVRASPDGTRLLAFSNDYYNRDVYVVELP